MAVDTTLALVLSGPTRVAEQEEFVVSLVNAHTLRVEGFTNKELDSPLRSFWDIRIPRN